MLKIRLSRIGKRKKPMYRLTIAEAARDTYGKALEILGSYNPFTKELIAKKERIEYWLKNGAKMSPTVNNLLIDKEVIKGEKVSASKKGKKKKEDEKQEEKVEGKKEEVKEEKKEEEKKEEKQEESK